jgi:hypothetical protein
MGAFARVQDDELLLDAGVFAQKPLPGRSQYRVSVSGSAGNAAALGRVAAAQLLDLGADGLLGDS